MHISICHASNHSRYSYKTYITCLYYLIQKFLNEVAALSHHSFSLIWNLNQLRRLDKSHMEKSPEILIFKYIYCFFSQFIFMFSHNAGCTLNFHTEWAGSISLFFFFYQDFSLPTCTNASSSLEGVTRKSDEHEKCVLLGSVRRARNPSFNLYNYKVMNNLSVKTIIAIDTGNYTAWTLLTSCIMANGSLLIAAGLMVMVKEKSTLQQSHNALIFKDNLKYCRFSTVLSISLSQAIK